MKIRIAVFFAGLLAISAASDAAPGHAQDFPAHPINVYIGFPPGSGADILTRFYADKMSVLPLRRAARRPPRQTDGPFSWQAENINYRAVNVWPRPYQQPHPPVWITGASPSSAVATAERGHVLATFLSGYATWKVFEVYRDA
ncbi:MAG: LLM class flavin-dependent oxidoreductase [Xanthobacteraceae bacterium]|nr:LLM class flavin-dependent oxidoreductase [Xanthobacteraceae bacterium]MBV9629967.1 LLM class flavin-dependent oxidoreductase [Xanthobacteraceae bacterium]